MTINWPISRIIQIMFLFYMECLAPTMEILSSSEFSFYKLSTCSIYAIKKTDFNKINMSKMNDTEVETFLMNDSRVARSNLELEGQYGSVGIDNPLESALVCCILILLGQ